MVGKGVGISMGRDFVTQPTRLANQVWVFLCNPPQKKAGAADIVPRKQLKQSQEIRFYTRG